MRQLVPKNLGNLSKLTSFRKYMKIYNGPIKVAMFGMLNLASSVFFTVFVPLK